MNITLVISSLESGGAERVMSALANYLVEKKHSVTIITLSAPTTQPFYSLRSAVTLHQINKLSLPSANICRRIKDILYRCYKLRKAIISSKPDVVLSFVDIMNITTLLAMKGTGIPIIVSERTDPKYHTIPYLYNWLRMKLYRDCYRVIVQTKSVLDYFSSPIKEKCQVIPNSSSLYSTSSKVIAKNPKLLVSVGRLDIYKNHKTLIQAMPRVIDKYPGVILKIYGEGDFRNYLQELIDRLCIQNNVHLEGITKNIQHCLEESDLFVFPSLYEGFPNALLEAMALGVPCIASNCSGNKDIIEDNVNGKLFEAQDISALSAFIIELLSNYDARKYFSIAAQREAQMYNSNNIFLQWESLFIEACSSKAKK